MDLNKLEQVIQLMEKYGLHELNFKSGEEEIKLVQAPPKVEALY